MNEAVKTPRLLRPSLLALGLLAVAWFVVRQPSRYEFDTRVVGEALTRFVATGRVPAEVGAFPLFQYLTGLPVEWLRQRGLPAEWRPGAPTAADLWAMTSLLSLGGLVWLFVRGGGGRGGRAAGVLAVVFLLASVFVPYAVSTFNELPAAFLAGAMVAVALGEKPRPMLLAGLFVAAGLTKEIAVASLLLLVGGALLVRRASGGEWKRTAMWLLPAAGLSIGLSAGFNVLRFGTPVNRIYLEGARGVEWGWSAEYAAALLLSPAGGLVWFFPGILVLIGAALRRRAGVFAAAFVGLQVVLLARWYSPFGWWCWGPRLLMPYLPAVVLLLLHGARGELGWLARRLLLGGGQGRGRAGGQGRERWGGWVGRAAFVLTAVGVVVVAVPHAAYILGDRVVPDYFTEVNPPESSLRGLTPEEAQHERISMQAWEGSPPLIVRPVLALSSLAPAWPAGVYLGGLVLLLVHARRCAAAETLTELDAGPAVDSTHRSNDC